MPPKGKAKKPKKLKPFEKCQEFMDGYNKLCERYDVLPLDLIGEIYNELIAKGKSCRKLPQLIQFAEVEVPGVQLRPLVEAFQIYDVKPKFLSFMNTNSGDEGFHMLASALIPPLEINGVAFINNNIGPSGCRGFARGLVQSVSLSVLELDYNHGMGDDGVCGLIHYGHCPTLLRLSLRCCSIGDKGAEAIGRWLALPTCNLQELILSGNEIGPDGITLFANFLPQNKSLQRIDLSDNMFGNNADALNALREGIAECSTLNSVIITNNFECPEGLDEKFFNLVQDKPLGEFEFTPKMDSLVFQNTRAVAMSNKKKIMKEAKKKKGGGEEKNIEEEEEEEKGEATEGNTTTTPGESEIPPTPEMSEAA
ncbi:hypothetical protein TRFO_21081 [Tritrichomonas foetus]|uniref:Leucine Rich Repeat family protein n=1 Tax=Tritrichomonas foetus TaxID=1144522 RepID=A0A1J4KFV0_9EUKA|nr:hypothetical protein TRFO_21081 [Tritrichomonas foetus]|eukprot:OHT09816.1 hypothetical protein TRFO_21081 [Tritrichomonas foetus]